MTATGSMVCIVLIPDYNNYVRLFSRTAIKERLLNMYQGICEKFTQKKIKNR